jgi:hypothetical protein
VRDGVRSACFYGLRIEEGGGSSLAGEFVQPRVDYGTVLCGHPSKQDAQPVPTSAYHARYVLCIGTEVGLFPVGHGKSDLCSRATIVAGWLGDPDGCLYGGCSPVHHTLNLLLNGLPHLRLIVNGDKPCRVNVESVCVVIHADIVAGDMTNRDQVG